MASRRLQAAAATVQWARGRRKPSGDDAGKSGGKGTQRATSKGWAQLQGAAAKQKGGPAGGKQGHGFAKAVGLAASIRRGVDGWKTRAFRKQFDGPDDFVRLLLAVKHHVGKWKKTTQKRSTRRLEIQKATLAKFGACVRA